LACNYQPTHSCRFAVGRRFGATLRCELTDSGQKYGIAVTVTSVDAGDVSFDYKVDDHAE
jgi:hypothetical protein